MQQPDAKWQTRELNAARELMNHASQALQQNALPAADRALAEANALLDMSGDHTDESLQLRARLLNEIGVLHQRRGDHQRALAFHQQAVEVCEALLDHDVDFRGNAAATYLNLSALEGAHQKVDDARSHAQRAIELVDSLRDEGDQNADPLAAGAYQNMALLNARQERWDEASDLLEKANTTARNLAERGDQMALPQAAQACQRLSVLLFEARQFDDALRWGVEAEQLAESGYELLGEPVLNIYVISQINLISFHEQMGSFADAEDALWKALEVAGNHPDILRRGRAFYENCRKQADARLQEGNLPRDEVDEGLRDLNTRIEEIGGLPDDDDQA